MYYTGVGGAGHAVFVMKDGVIVGADALGGMVDGTYSDADGDLLDVSVTVTVPAGASLVTGITAGKEPLKQIITTVLPKNLGGGTPIGVETPTGPVNVVFRRLRGIP